MSQVLRICVSVSVSVSVCVRACVGVGVSPRGRVFCVWCVCVCASAGVCGLARASGRAWLGWACVRVHGPGVRALWGVWCVRCVCVCACVCVCVRVCVCGGGCACARFPGARRGPVGLAALAFGRPPASARRRLSALGPVSWPPFRPCFAFSGWSVSLSGLLFVSSPCPRPSVSFLPPVPPVPSCAIFFPPLLPKKP